MLFCQLGRSHSLREICGGLASREGSPASGVHRATRTTLAYANAHRPWQLYEQVYYQLLGRCREVVGAKKFRFKNKPLTLDATVIELAAATCGRSRTRGARSAPAHIENGSRQVTNRQRSTIAHRRDPHPSSPWLKAGDDTLAEQVCRQLKGPRRVAAWALK
jgi:hypothetical protein